MFFCDDNACTHGRNTDHFSECVERHAYSTYDKFLKLHEGKAALMGFYYLFIYGFWLLKLAKHFYPCHVRQSASEDQTVLILCHHVSRFSVSIVLMNRREP